MHDCGFRRADLADFSGQLRMDGIITDRYPYQKAPQAFAEFDSDGANMLRDEHSVSRCFCIATEMKVLIYKTIIFFI
jgi:hypothetical protein